MRESANIPASAACGQWEILLADALDGQLRTEDEAEFSAHKDGCARCGEMFDDARQGREWLGFLSAEPEVPEGLLEKILAQTGHETGHKVGILAGRHFGAGLRPAYIGGAQGVASFPAWQQPGFMGSVRRFAEPRLMMTAAMAFFSIALSLNLAGVKPTELRLADMRPAVVRSLVERRLTMASVPIVRYYDHLRLVYEVESGMRELENDTNGANGGGGNDNGTPQQQKAAPGGNGVSEQNGQQHGQQNDRGKQNRKNGDGPQGAPPQSDVAAPHVFTGDLEAALSGRDRSCIWTA